jgi:hypothetical protein
MPLTRFQIEKTKPQGKPLKLFDGRGLYLEISPSGILEALCPLPFALCPLPAPPDNVGSSLQIHGTVRP